MDYTNTYLIFIGSILTFLATSAVEVLKWSIGRREKRTNFILLSKQQLEAVHKGLDKLKTVLEYKNYFDFSTLDILEKGASTLENYKNDSIYPKSERAKEQFIDLITDVSLYVSDVRGLQNFYYTESPKIGKDSTALFNNLDDLNKYFNEQKNLKIIDMVELKRRILDFAREVE